MDTDSKDYAEQKEITLMLRDARSVLGIEQLQSFLPTPLKLRLVPHDTGCFANIVAYAPGRTPLAVWMGSAWRDAQYLFNDRYEDRHFGLMPGCEWAKPALDLFFQTVRVKLAETEVSRAMAKAHTRVAADRRHSEDNAFYRAMLLSGTGTT